MSRDALVVGISSYRWLPDLGAPANDAEAIAQILHAHGDFHVSRMPEIVKDGQPRVGVTTPVTVAELESALVKLFKPKGKNIPQTALFYFSGHGLQKDAGIQEGYLATSDTNPEHGVYGLSLYWLRRLLLESPVRQRIIILDCCHSGELLNILEADPGANAGTDRLFMAAAREYESAYESLEGKYSVFTQALLDGLDPSCAPNGTVTNYHLTDWVSNALRGELQQPLFENSGSEILLTRGTSQPTLIKTDLTEETCPYRGLEYFDEVHADFFFGREELTDQLIEKLRTKNFVALAGASGSGKSSLIRAGLVHTLRQGRRFSGSDRWQIKIMTPTDQPFKSLAAAFVNPKASAVDRADQLRRAEILLKDVPPKDSSNDANGLTQLIRASLMDGQRSPDSRMLLIIDQFEEVFTLCEGPHAERERHRFFNSLTAALKVLRDQLSVVIVLRADFFGKCSLYPALTEQIEQNLMTVTPLTYDQIKASIVKPAQRVGLQCDSNLVYNILRDIVGSPGELPLLQYTLLELWHQRQCDPETQTTHLTLDAYTELGGVRGTLQKRADEIFYSLSPEEQTIAKRIFIALTQLGDGTEDTRRRILKSELVSPRFGADLVDRVIEKLVTAKLIVTNRIAPTSRHQERINQRFANVSTALRFAQMCRGKSPQQHETSPSAVANLQTALTQESNTTIARMTQLPTSHLSVLQGAQGTALPYQETIDVAHETLIRHWPLLRIWVDENRDMLRRQRRIEQAAREWDSVHQPRSVEHLLRGTHLLDAEEFLEQYVDELSELARRYIHISRHERQRSHKEMRLLQLSIPCTLLAALSVTLYQYHTMTRSQADKDYQLRLATSRQQAAVSEKILKDPDGDPTTALLISRLAAENTLQTQEVEDSLRSALQKLGLQANLMGHQGAVRSIDLHPQQPRMATSGEDGQIRLWSLKTYQTEQVLQWSDPTNPQPAQSETLEKPKQTSTVTFVTFSPNGQQIAAIAHNTNYVQVWTDAGKFSFRLGGFQQAVTQVVFSPNSQWIAVSSADQTVRVWNATNGALQSQTSCPEAIRSLSFSPDNQQLLMVCGRTAKLINPKTGNTQKNLVHEKSVESAAFHAQGQWIATGSIDGRITLWNAKTGQVRSRLSHPDASEPLPITQIQFSPDGQSLAALDQQQRAILWTLSTGQVKAEIRDSVPFDSDTPHVPQMRFSPDSQHFALTYSKVAGDRAQHNIGLWHVQTGQRVTEFQAHTDAIEALQFSPDGTLLATASLDGSARIWSTELGGELPTLKMTGKPGQWATFRHFPQRSGEVLTIAMDGSIQRWDLPQMAPKSTLRSTLRSSIHGRSQASLSTVDSEISAHSLRVKVLKLFKRAGGLVTSLGAQNAQNAVDSEQTLPPATAPLPYWTHQTLAAAPTQVPAVMQADRPAPLREKLAPGAILTSVAFSSDPHLMATVTNSGDVRVWQVHDQLSVTQIRQLSQPAARSRMVKQLVFSADNRYLLGIGDDQTVHVWNVVTGEWMYDLRGHEAVIQQAHFSPDSQQIVTASRDHSVRLWSVTSGQFVRAYQHHSPVNSARFNAEGTSIVVAGQDGSAQILDAETLNQRVLMPGHSTPLVDAEFSPDGTNIVTASEDGTARLWDAKTGSERTHLSPGAKGSGAEPLERAFFSRDGQYVATLSRQGQVRLWVATWDGLLSLARDRSTRQLQPEECLRYLSLPKVCPTIQETNLPQTNLLQTNLLQTNLPQTNLPQK